ncbi:nucleotidyl transferase AbiEii/AbiGii toxin family protein [Mycobacterium sp. 1245852.3]|uniref:nucleotidyl transferase AbiEii/AbiGii toxin family protein n=1 Tax=Mycobacterium sp. 1245852.3 TaxID=1856860 RepID=UPI001E2D0825|nr:nucleotidyl transferase AbiEii/AbiGii toxin family protein [Mycobacterium sp. 1245852.3]
MPPRLRDNRDELDALLARAAEALNRPVSFLEKDFWAMEVLRVAAVDRSITYGNGDSTGTVRTVFKGGTSLSRVHGLIDRFSEDVDLLVLFPDNDGGPGTGARDGVLKAIQAEVQAHLGLPDERIEVIYPKRGIARAVKYYYPLHTAVDTALTEGVTLEMGTRGGPEPMKRYPLRSIVAEYAIDELEEPEDQWEEFTPFEVNVLGAERTLLEKLSAVHSNASDPELVETKLPQSGRHFYDIHMLLQSEEVRSELVRIGRSGVEALVLDIEERSAAAQWRFVPRPADGYASSPAFASDGPVATAVRSAYLSAEALMYGPVVPLEECLASVHIWAELL